jgi:DNA mismatch endonuclease (patch repair protein)
MDTLTPDQRSERMRLVRGKDTQPEVALRRLVSGLGLRYRKNARDLPGKPDLVFARRRKVIFVHGCFWHRHACALGRLPKSRQSFWKPKLEGNRKRDLRNARQLKKDGWRVLVVWECQLRHESRVARRVRGFLNA